jgi:lipopolysaccharide biosynthesis regulator YciM
VSDWTSRHRVAAISVSVIALVAAGCASARPLASTKISQAERAVDEAQQVGAVTTASAELRVAEDKLKEAQAAMVKGDYDNAMRLADQAAADADYARARAINVRVTKAVDDMKQNIQVLRQELERLPR